MSLLDIRNLSVEFGARAKPFRAVENVNLTVKEGEIVGIVGESGSGKSVTMMAMMGLLEKQGRVSADMLQFNGNDMLNMSARERRKIIGKDIAMIFQDPMSSLNPSYTVGRQIMEVLTLHHGLKGSALRDRAIELMTLVEIPDPARRLEAYPHQLSGGMSQRVMIAMAIACKPKLLIADEPTTALDVTIQAQVMELLLNLQKTQGMALILITHDLAVVAEIAHKAVVMYAGQVAEVSAVPAIFRQPHHPYTQALLKSIPEHSKGTERLFTLPGIVPGQFDRPVGCLLAPRCPYVQEQCRTQRPELRVADHYAVRCHFPLSAEGQR